MGRQQGTWKEEQRLRGGQGPAQAAGASDKEARGGDGPSRRRCARAQARTPSKRVHSALVETSGQHAQSFFR